jgi:hypothetical protein
MKQVLSPLFKLERRVNELLQREEDSNQNDVDIIGIYSKQPFYGVHNGGLKEMIGE